MDSLVLNAETLRIIDNMLNEITGYGRDRKTNFTVDLLDENEMFKVSLIYNDTKTVIFTGFFNKNDLIEAIKNEDKKEKETRIKDISK